MKRLSLPLLMALALASAAHAQNPPFPASLPPNTVVGRISPVAGPAQAVSLAQLRASVNGSSETLVNDAAYAAVSTDTIIVYTALTASRVTTLFAASAVPAGTTITVLDRSGSASASQTIILSPNGTDTVNGANATFTAITSPYAAVSAESDGVSKWTVRQYLVPSPTMTGNWTFNPASGNAITITTAAGSPQTINGFVITNSPSGTFGSNQLATNQIFANDRTVNATGSLAAFQSQYGATATASQGNGIGVLGVAVTLANTNVYSGIGVQGLGQASKTATGPTGLSGAGQALGGNFIGMLLSGATNYFNVTGAEFDLSVPTGASVKYKSGIQVALNPTDTQRGATYDIAVSVGSNSASNTWKYAFAVSKAHGQAPLGSDSTVLAALDGPLQVNSFIDFSAYTCSGGKEINFTNFVVDCSGNLGTVGNVNLGAANILSWNGRATMQSPVDGIIELTNNAGTAFTRLQLGGTTNAFPSIKRTAAALNFRLADDSADAAITAGATTLSGALTYGGVTLSNSVTGTGSMALSTSPTIATPTFTTSFTSPKHIGGSGTTGVQLTLQTTTGVGTTDELDIVGGNNGGTTFATFTAAAGIYVPITNIGFSLKNSAGSPYPVLNSGASGHYTVLNAPSNVTFFQARDADNTGGDANFGYLNNDTLQITNRANNANFAKIDTNGLTVQTGGVSLAALAWSRTAPTISAGFCTSPSIVANNGVAAFTINVGSACAASTGTIGMPTATTGWVCTFHDVTTPASNIVEQTGGTASTVTLTNYVRTTGVAGNFTSSDVIRASCTGY